MLRSLVPEMKTGVMSGVEKPIKAATIIAR
jgi:hypothetical protein